MKTTYPVLGAYPPLSLKADFKNFLPTVTVQIQEIFKTSLCKKLVSIFICTSCSHYTHYLYPKDFAVSPSQRMIHVCGILFKECTCSSILIPVSRGDACIARCKG